MANPRDRRTGPGAWPPTELTEPMNVRHRTARRAWLPLLLLLDLLLPATGRRRRRRRPAPAPYVTAPTSASAPTPRRPAVPLLRGEDNALVRPYVEALR